MANNSSTGGYLSPEESSLPLTGKLLRRFVHDFIAGITGIPGDRVRPILQAEPPNAPHDGDVWCAFSVTIGKADPFAHIQHVPVGDGTTSYDELRRHEKIAVLASFYDLGVDQLADQKALVLRDGMQLPQNLEALTAANFGFVASGDPVEVPTLVKDRWQYRIDLPFTLRRQNIMKYPILNIESADIVIHEDTDPPRSQTIEVHQ